MLSFISIVSPARLARRIVSGHAVRKMVPTTKDSPNGRVVRLRGDKSQQIEAVECQDVGEALTFVRTAEVLS
jgi:hypothetical protein